MAPKVKCRWCRQGHRPVVLDANGAPHDSNSKVPPLGSCHTYGNMFWLCQDVHPEAYASVKHRRGAYPLKLYTVGKSVVQQAVRQKVSNPNRGALGAPRLGKTDLSNISKLHAKLKRDPATRGG